MAVIYKKLWNLLINKDMKKSGLEREAKITYYAIVNNIAFYAEVFSCEVPK